MRWSSVWLGVGVAAVAVAAAIADGDSGLGTWWALRADLRDARARIAALRREVSELEREAAALEADPFALERAIRERLEYARAGETLVRLPRERTNTRIP